MFTSFTMQEALSWSTLTCIRGQPVAASSLLHRGFSGLNSGHQACKQSPSLTEPSHYCGALLKTNKWCGTLSWSFPTMFSFEHWVILHRVCVCVFTIFYFSVYILEVILVATKSRQLETSVQRFLYLYKFLPHLGKNWIQLLGHTLNRVWQEIKEEKVKERKKGWRETKWLCPFAFRQQWLNVSVVPHPHTRFAGGFVC